MLVRGGGLASRQYVPLRGKLPCVLDMKNGKLVVLLLKMPSLGSLLTLAPAQTSLLSACPYILLSLAPQQLKLPACQPARMHVLELPANVDMHACVCQ